MSDLRLTPGRSALAGVGALVGWLALALQLVLSIQLALGNARSTGWGVFMYFGYFTVLTNVLVAVVLSAAWTRSCAAFWQLWRRPGVTTAVATSITVVGLVYFFVLRHIWAPQGLLWLADVLLHYVMPLLFLLWWWQAVPARALRWRDLPWWWAYPLGYLVYAMVRGAIWGVYPYPFVDVATLGPGRVALNAVGILAGYSAIALLLIVVGRVKPRP
ncbi:Pr6Pr family membrane protein [Variovorax sp. RT4R15]|uniref:Pr6Pr family membrane protein n=1 Tax=Variovorax sp. RT4R15 TaxID=3443737 RepID=UPI003F4875F4